MLSSTVQRPFRLNRMAGDRIADLLQDGCLRLLESASGLAALDRLYQGGDWPQSPHAFCGRAGTVHYLRNDDYSADLGKGVLN